MAKDIKLKIEDIELDESLLAQYRQDPKRLEQAGLGGISEIFSHTGGMLVIEADGVNLLEDVASDYIASLMLSLLDTLESDPKNIGTKYSDKNIAKQWATRRRIEFMDDPWTIKLMLKEASCDLELYWGDELNAEARGLSWRKYEKEVLRLAESFLQRMLKTAPEFAEAEGVKRIQERLARHRATP
jgi:hypothetical protein